MPNTINAQNTFFGDEWGNKNLSTKKIKKGGSEQNEEGINYQLSK